VAAEFDFLFDGPAKAKTTIALAHGAGAGMDSPFLNYFAKGLGKQGFRVVRFNYPYMTAKLIIGKGKPPDREPVLRETWLTVIKKLGPKGIVIGAKSMGGRIASLVADDRNADSYFPRPLGDPVASSSFSSSASRVMETSGGSQLFVPSSLNGASMYARALLDTLPLATPSVLRTSIA
jgi:predicted alpha/beta-hydrolase family hydrolase